MIRLAFYVRDIQEIIRGSGGIEYSYVSTKANKVSTLRGPAQLADLLGTFCVPAQYPYTTLTKPSIRKPSTIHTIEQQYNGNYSSKFIK